MKQKNKNCCKIVEDKIMDADDLAPSAAKQITLGEDSLADKTFLGGFLSILIYSYLAYVILEKGFGVVFRDSPYIVQMNQRI